VSSERQPERHPHVHLHAPLRPAHRRPAHRRRCRALREVRQPALIGVGAERPPRAAPRLRSPVPSSVPHTPPHPGAASRFSRAWRGDRAARARRASPRACGSLPAAQSALLLAREESESIPDQRRYRQRPPCHPRVDLLQEPERREAVRRRRLWLR
jgi:hypothetical protein